MRYIENMYCGKTIENISEIKEMLNNGISIFGTYVICIQNNGNNLMDILTTTQLLKPINIQKKYVIIGIANSKAEALSLVQKIISDYLKTKRSLNYFKTYFLRDKI